MLTLVAAVLAYDWPLEKPGRLLPVMDRPLEKPGRLSPTTERPLESCGRPSSLSSPRSASLRYAMSDTSEEKDIGSVWDQRRRVAALYEVGKRVQRGINR